MTASSPRRSCETCHVGGSPITVANPRRSSLGVRLRPGGPRREPELRAGATAPRRRAATVTTGWCCRTRGRSSSGGHARHVGLRREGASASSATPWRGAAATSATTGSRRTTRRRGRSAIRPARASSAAAATSRGTARAVSATCATSHVDLDGCYRTRRRVLQFCLCGRANCS